MVHVAARRAAYRSLVPAAALGTDTIARRTAQWEQRLADPRSRCWLLSSGTELAGFVHSAPADDPDLGDDSVEVKALYLLDHVVGRGWGRLTLTHALRESAEAGYREVVLWCAVKNGRAVRFYQAAGFRTDDRALEAPLGETGLTKRRLRRDLP